MANLKRPADEWVVGLLGERGAGKKALASQWMSCHKDIYDPTIERDWSKEFMVDDRRCTFKLLLPGFTPYDQVAQNRAIHTCAAFLLVYSIASRRSFEQLEAYRQVAVKASQEGDPLLVLVGTQCDRIDEREVSKEEGARLARKLRCEFFETSAKTGKNVVRVFADLARTLRKAVASGEDASLREPETKRRRRCIIL